MTRRYLSERGLLLSAGTIVDASIINEFDEEPGPAAGP